MILQKTTSVITILFCFITININAAICTALGNGNWSNPANWSCGQVPSCGDYIYIPTGITVNVDIQVDLDENSSPACSTATYIQVSGTLQFITGNKISLACGSGVEIMPGGSMLNGGGGGQSNWLKICQITVWQSSDGNKFGYKLFGKPIPLPVTFIDFSIEEVNGKFDFSWIVTSERENDFFTISYSKDGINWEKIVDEFSIGTHSSVYQYQILVDFSINSYSSVYFKLSQTDINGSSTSLKIMAFKSSTDEVNIFPNPCNKTDLLNIFIGSDETRNSSITVFNSIGQIVLNQEFNLKVGNNLKQLNIEFLENGFYHVKIDNFSEQKIFQLIVE